MRMSEVEALFYLKERGVDIKRDTYYKTLVKIRSMTKQRLFEIAKNFTELHIDRIDKIRTIEQELLNMLKSKKEIYLMEKIDVKGVDENGHKTHTKKSTPVIKKISLSPTEKTTILKVLLEVQPYLSAYEEASAKVMENYAQEPKVNMNFLDAGQ